MGRAGLRLEAGLTSFEAQLGGEFDVVSDDFRSLTGRPPLGVTALVARLADMMPLRSKGGLSP
jgi:hypothetical protein